MRKTSEKFGQHAGKMELYAQNEYAQVYLYIFVYLSNTIEIYDAVNRKQDTQCTYNITLRRLRATIVAVEGE